jgi:branched-chain amino acid transport system substrate-binding protein
MVIWEVKMARRAACPLFAIELLVLAVFAASAPPASAQLSGQDIHIGVGGPLTTGSATFGVEMRQAIDLAVAEKNAAGGVLGAKIVADALDDKADAGAGESVANAFCAGPALGIVGHVNSGVTIAASKVYATCSLAMITPMSSNPAVTENGLANVFRLTNRDDRKGPGLAAYLIDKMGKRRAVVIDDGTQYGKGLAESFSKGFEAKSGAIAARVQVKVGDTQFADLVNGLPKDFDLLFFAGIREGSLILKAMRDQGVNQLFACGDGCWDVKGFILPAAGAAEKGEGVRILSAAPALGKVPGSAEFAAAYNAKYGAINNYAANSYDSARVLIAAIEAAAKAKGAVPSRADVLSALKGIKFQGVAYVKPVEWSAKGDNLAAVIFVNKVEGDRFQEIDQIGQ